MLLFLSNMIQCSSPVMDWCTLPPRDRLQYPRVPVQTKQIQKAIESMFVSPDNIFEP